MRAICEAPDLARCKLGCRFGPGSGDEGVEGWCTGAGRDLRESVMSKYVLAFRGQPGGTPSPEEEQWFASLGRAIADRGNRAAPERTLARRSR
jgi:hypothetical protein